nr:MAG: hypothetical protein DIU60_00030 [Actinomycetota bacterium]
MSRSGNPNASGVRSRRAPAARRAGAGVRRGGGAGSSAAPGATAARRAGRTGATAPVPRRLRHMSRRASAT